MFKDILSRVFVPQHLDPEVVSWSPQTRGHTEDPEGGKDLIYGDVILCVSAPRFHEDTTSIYVAVSNMGRKALGFGVAGFGLVLITGAEKSSVNCRGLSESRRGGRWISSERQVKSQSLIVDVHECGDYDVHFVAEFPPVTQSDSAMLVIQANRILFRPLVFFFPFDLSGGLRRECSSAENCMLCTNCGTEIAQDSAFCHRCGVRQIKSCIRAESAEDSFKDILIARYRQIAEEAPDLNVHHIFMGAKNSILLSMPPEPEALKAYQLAEKELFGTITYLAGEPRWN